MESTGSYHELALLWLHSQGIDISLVLPNKIKAHARALNIKTKTDRIDANVIASYARTYPLDLWQPLSEQTYFIREVLRERRSLIVVHTMHQNRTEAIKPRIVIRYCFSNGGH